nr:methyl-accepting chemotaxis protein [Nitrospiraceae bacterium]
MFQLFNDMKIGFKITIGFVALLLISAYLVYEGFSSLESTAFRVERADDANRIAKMMVETRRDEKNYMLRGDANDIDVVRKEVDNIKKQAAAAKEQFKTIENKKQMDDVIAGISKYEKEFEGVVQLFKSTGREADVRKAAESRADALKSSEKELMDGARMVETAAAEARKTQKLEMENAIAISEKTMIISGIIGLITGLLIAFIITRSITRPLSEGVNVANALAKGDLTMEIEIKSRDETGLLLGAMKDMLDTLKGVVADVQTAADNVASGSQQLSSGSEQMSQGTTEQAASAEEA